MDVAKWLLTHKAFDFLGGQCLAVKEGIVDGSTNETYGVTIAGMAGSKQHLHTVAEMKGGPLKVITDLFSVPEDAYPYIKFTR